MSSLPPILVELKANAGEFMAKMGEARHEVGKLHTEGAGHFAKLHAVASAALFGVATAAVGVGVASLEMADKFEGARARLEGAVHNVGGNFDRLRGSVEALDSRMAKLGFVNTDVESSLATLTAATHNPAKAMRDMALAADIARGRHIDLATASGILVKVETGHVGLLGRLGIATKDATGKTISQKEALKRLSDLYGGQAARYTETFAGKQAALRAQVENMGVKLGLVLIPQLLRLATFISQDVVPALSTMGRWVRDNKSWLEPLAIAVGATVVAVKLGVAAYQAWKIASEAVRGAIMAVRGVMLLLNITLAANPIGLVVIAVAALAVGLVVAYRHSETFRKIVNAAFDGVKAAAKAVADFFTGPFLRGMGTMVSVFAHGAKLMFDVWSSVVGGIINGAAKAMGWVPGLGGKLKAAARAFNGFKRDVDGALSATARSAEGWGQAIGDSLSSGLTIGIRQGAGKINFVSRQVVNGAIQVMHHAASAASPSKKTIQLGKWLAEGLIIGFTGSRQKVFDALTKTMQQAMTRLESAITKAQQKIADKVAATKQKLADDITARNDLAASVASSLASGSSLSGAFDSNTSKLGNLGDYLAASAKREQGFTWALGQLKNKGLSPDLLQQIAGDGAALGGAEAGQILSGKAGSVSSLNSLEASIMRADKASGALVADSAYAKQIAADKQARDAALAEQKKQTHILNSLAYAVGAEVAAALTGKGGAKALRNALLDLRKATGMTLGFT